MLAYTAWDGLQNIARQFDADLTLDAEAHVRMAPRRERFLSALSALRRNTASRRRG